MRPLRKPGIHAATQRWKVKQGMFWFNFRYCIPIITIKNGQYSNSSLII